MHYVLDPDRSTATVHASSSVHPITSSARVEGWLEVTLDDEGYVDPEAPVDGFVTVDLTRMRSGNPLVDREAERRLHIRRFPTMEGRLLGLRFAGEDADHGHHYDGDGELTFHGVTLPLEGGLSVIVEEEDLRLEGDTELDVTDYGVQPPSLIVIKVHARVRIELHAVARRDGSG